MSGLDAMTNKDKGPAGKEVQRNDLTGPASTAASAEEEEKKKKKQRGQDAASTATKPKQSVDSIGS